MTVSAGLSVATTGGGDPAVPFPPVVGAGDHLLVFAKGSIATVFPTDAMADAGFALRNVQDSGGVSPTIAIFHRVANGGETGTAALTSAGGGGAYWAAMVAVPNIDGLNPFDCPDGVFNSSGAPVANYDISPQTTTRGGCTLFNFVAGNTTGGAWTPAIVPGTFVELYDEADTINRMHVGVLENWTGSGSTGTRRVVKTGTATRGAGLGIALRPAGAGPKFQWTLAGSGAVYSLAGQNKIRSGGAWVVL